MKMVKSERKKCLKCMWKVYMVSTMKVNSEHEGSSLVYLPKNVEELTFEQLYREKVADNPLLKLVNFLNKHSIFRIKAGYFQRLVSLFCFESQKIRETKQIVSFQRKKTKKIKFMEEDDQEHFSGGHSSSEVLPYSLHYNILMHPKNFGMMVPEMMKTSERWAN